MGRSSKRKKIDGIQFNIGKRIKVQAQRKFAQGVSVLPGQVPKDTLTTSASVNASISTAASTSATASTSAQAAASTSAQTEQANVELNTNQTRRTEGKPKVYTEDFLTYLCFKGSPSLPPHIRTGSFLRPQSISPSPSNSVPNNQGTSQTSQSIPQVQGFIPFGVRKRASQFPKRPMRKHKMHAMKGKFNQRKPAITPNPKNTGNKRKIFTRASMGKTISKKKQSISVAAAATYSIATRRQNYQQKPIRKTIPAKSKTLHLRNSVSLRNRVVNITAPKNNEKPKPQGVIKKKALKPVVKVPILKTETTKVTPKKEASSKESIKVNNKNQPTPSNDADPPGVSTRTKSSAIVKNEPVCLTRSATMKQLTEVCTPKTKPKLSAPTPTKVKVEPTVPKKLPEKPIEKFDFSSDDDEPLYKKISKTPDITSADKNVGEQQRLTRSTIKDKTDTPTEKTVVAKTPNKVNRVVPPKPTPKEVPQKEKSPAVSPQTRSKTVVNAPRNLRKLKRDPSKVSQNNATIEKSKAKIVRPATKTTKVAKKQATPPKFAKKEIEVVTADKITVEVEKVTPPAVKKAKVETKPPKLPIDTIKHTDKKIEKSFSESDDEPLATKVTDTTTRSSTGLDKASAKRRSVDKMDDNSSSSDTQIADLQTNTKIRTRKLVIDENSKSVSSNISDTNPIPSYEESFKVFGIAHRNVTNTKETAKGKATNQAKKQPIPKEPIVADRKHEFRGNFDASAAQKNEVKNRQGRKFMKSKEYIEQWLKNSASTFTNRPQMRTAVHTTDKDASLGESPDFENYADQLPRKSDAKLTSTPICDNAGTAAIIKPNPPAEKDSKITGKLTTPNKIDDRSDTSSKKIVQPNLPTEESSNIYEFESDSEILATPPRKFKDSQKKVDKNQSVFGTNKKIVPNFSFGENVQGQEVSCESVNTSKDIILSELDGYILSGNKTEISTTGSCDGKQPIEFFGNVISDAIITSLNSDDIVPSNSQQNPSEQAKDISVSSASIVAIATDEQNVQNDNVSLNSDCEIAIATDFDCTLEEIESATPPPRVIEIFSKFFPTEIIFEVLKFNDEFLSHLRFGNNSENRSGVLKPIALYNTNKKRTLEMAFASLHEMFEPKFNILIPVSEFISLSFDTETVNNNNNDNYEKVLNPQPECDPSIDDVIKEEIFPDFVTTENNYYPDVNYDPSNALPCANEMVYNNQLELPNNTSNYPQFYPQPMECTPIKPHGVQSNSAFMQYTGNTYQSVECTTPAFNEQPLLANYSDNFNTNKNIHNPNLNFQSFYEPQQQYRGYANSDNMGKVSNYNSDYTSFVASSQNMNADSLHNYGADRSNMMSYKPVPIPAMINQEEVRRVDHSYPDNFNWNLPGHWNADNSKPLRNMNEMQVNYANYGGCDVNMNQSAHCDNSLKYPDQLYYVNVFNSTNPMPAIATAGSYNNPHSNDYSLQFQNVTPNHGVYNPQPNSQQDQQRMFNQGHVSSVANDYAYNKSFMNRNDLNSDMRGVHYMNVMNPLNSSLHKYDANVTQSQYQGQTNKYDPLLSNGCVPNVRCNNTDAYNINNNQLPAQNANFDANFFNYNPNTKINSGSTNIYFAETETLNKNPLAAYQNSLFSNFKQQNIPTPQPMFNNSPSPIEIKAKVNEIIDNIGDNVSPIGTDSNTAAFGSAQNYNAFKDVPDFDVTRQAMNANPIYGSLVINKNSKIPVVHIKPTMAESMMPIQPSAFYNKNECSLKNDSPATLNKEIKKFTEFLMQERGHAFKQLNASTSSPGLSVDNKCVGHEERVAVNDQPQKPNEVEDHLFYIPLTDVKKKGCDKCNHFIEGVAVQMESEGPDGPQQRVIMRAKLIKKSQLNKNSKKNTKQNTDAMLDMVRSVREAFPEATIHTEQSRNQNVALPTVQNTTAKAKSQTNTAAQQINGASSSSGVQQPTVVQRAGRAPDRVETIGHRNNTTFPQVEDPPQVVEAPVFQPTEKEFQDPLEFIEKISPVAARYGLCKIIPPPSFKSECKISDDMRFTPHNQYLHRMLNRWGPSSREMCAIKKYLATQSVTFKQPPILSGIEVDLPKLYHIVQNMGGLNKVLEKKMWHKVAEEMCLPQNVHYMDIRLDEIYCKYLLPYDTLSPDERKKLFESVDTEWEKRQERMMARAANPLNLMSGAENDEPEYDMTEDIEECITRGKSTTLCSYARIAKNTMTMQFGKVQQPSPEEVETKFWDYVTTRDSHVCVSTGSIDSSVWGYGFPNAKTKNSPIAKHPWNLKVLTNNTGSVLRSLTPIMGVNVPTIHVGMLFSTCCWYRDPHGLPWIEYLHDGAPKIWYGVPDSQSAKFKETLTSVVPNYCQKKTIWLLSDTTMVPPTMLTDHGVSLCRTIQNPGEFILVFPKAFTSSICAGYNVSESVYFALNSWLDTAQQDFVDIRNSCEPSMFSLERLIVSISEDVRTPYHVLKKVLPALDKIIQAEKQHRDVLFNIGLKVSERTQNVLMGRKKVVKRQDEMEECHRCRSSLSLSMLFNDADSSVYCLLHGAEFLSANKSQIENCKLVYTNSIDELERLQSKLIERLNTLANKKCGKSK